MNRGRRGKTQEESLGLAKPERGGALGKKLGEFCASRIPRVGAAALATALNVRTGQKISDSRVRNWFSGENGPEAWLWPYIAEIVQLPPDFFEDAATFMAVQERMPAYHPRPTVEIPPEVADTILDAIEDPATDTERKRKLRDFLTSVISQKRQTA
jgi:hypothetical protein